MRAKQSITASGKDSRFGSITTPTSTRADGSDACVETQRGFQYSSCLTAGQGEGMLHDARNLLGAIGLYCDLLALPGVLKPEHSQYPDELRHLGDRSGALIDALMRSLLMREGSTELSPAARAGARQRGVRAEPQMAPQGAASLTKPVSLRVILEGCSGLLQRVANGRTLDVELGPAADATVRIPEEAVERILVNLVRNAVAALDCADPRVNSDGTIRITLGLLQSRVGGARPWLFQRIRLSVEDTGCGMSSCQVESLLNGIRPSSGDSHGIGFRVVRELTAASDGDLRVVSAVGSGTRVQIEWPVATMSAREVTIERVAGRTRCSLSQLHCTVPPPLTGGDIPPAWMEVSC